MKMVILASKKRGKKKEKARRDHGSWLMIMITEINLPKCGD